MDIHGREQPGIDTRKLNGRVSPKKAGIQWNPLHKAAKQTKAKPLVSIKTSQRGRRLHCRVVVMNNKDRNRVGKAVAQRVRGTANQWDTSRTPWRVHCAPAGRILGFITDEIACHAICRARTGGRRRRGSAQTRLYSAHRQYESDQELESQEIAALRQYRVDGFLYAMMYVPPCCGIPANSTAHGRRRQRRRIASSLDLPRRRNGGVHLHLSCHSRLYPAPCRVPRQHRPLAFMLCLSRHSTGLPSLSVNSGRAFPVSIL